MIEALRTPDERFAGLPGFPFAPHYCADLEGYAGLRLHYLDEGPRDAGRTFLCLHGEPSWSYLYRKVIPFLAAAGHRAVAPDYFGFGRSDKPVEEAVYTFDFHRGALLAFIERLDLRDITLVCQDWGGLLGLTLPLDMAERFTGLLVMNTALGTGDGPLSEGFVAWVAWVAANPDIPVDRLMARSCPMLRPEEVAAYIAPFPDQRYKAGPRRFPQLVPARPDDGGAALSRRARDWWRHQWSGRSCMVIGMTDPVLGPPAMRALASVIRNCPPPIEVAEAGHFVQEWAPLFMPQALAMLG
ncbi:MAG TPA: haloalkane dehalogenase [Stellaceae bacterium]|nr:haloalkane dehalogenase [Stellaceae bacterium]